MGFYKSWSIQPAIKLFRHWLALSRPRFRDKRFWAVQGFVIGIAAVHFFLEAGGYLSHSEALLFLPTAVLLIPIIYAALNFGFIGSFATALWAVALTLPNVIIWHRGLEMWGEFFQMSILVIMGFFIGQRVDREAKARQEAEAASKAMRTYAASLVSAQEDERQRIARELHDETIQTLALICRQLGSLQDSKLDLPPSVISQIREIQGLSEEAVKELRDFMRALRPPILEDLGLVPSVRRLLADATERMGIKGRLELVGEEKRLPEGIEISMYRIAQEALWNIERHSKATEVEVMIRLDGGEVVLSIRDNGIGFYVPPSLSGFSTAGKLGLLGMQERAEQFGGKLYVESKPGNGTKVTVSIRLPAAS